MGVYIMGMRIKRTKRTKPVCSMRDGFDAANLLAATLIASDPMTYPEGSLMAEWADLVLSKAAVLDNALAGPLFESRAA